MLLAVGAILLQVSSVVPHSLPTPRPSEPPVAAAVLQPSTASQAVPASLGDVKLTNLNFDGDDSTGLPAVSLRSNESSQSLSTIHIPQKPVKPVGVKPAETYPRRTWLLLAVAQHGAAAFDAYSTRYAVGHGAVEENPLMRPFAHSPSIYAVSQITPTVFDLIGHRMLRSQNGFIRHMWWLPQSMSAGVYTFAGIHNFGIVHH